MRQIVLAGRDMRGFLSGDGWVFDRVVAEPEPPPDADQQAEDARTVECPGPAEVQDHPGSDRRGSDRTEIEAAKRDRIALGALAVREPTPDCHDRTWPVRRLPDAEQDPDGNEAGEGAAQWCGSGKDGP